MHKLSQLIAILGFAIITSACQSIDDIDFKSKDPACAETCYKRYDECIGRITMMPIRKHNDCVDNLRFCAQQCPSPTSAQSTSGKVQDNVAKLEALGKLKKQGLITNQDYEAKKKQILDSM